MASLLFAAGHYHVPIQLGDRAVICCPQCFPHFPLISPFLQKLPFRWYPAILTITSLSPTRNAASRWSVRRRVHRGFRL